MTVSTILFLITYQICVIFACTNRPLLGASFQPISKQYFIVKVEVIVEAEVEVKIEVEYL